MLIHTRARYYLPEALRYVNADTLKGTIQDSTTLNYYAYVNGNPISLIDPLGMSSEPGTSNNTGLIDITVQATTILKNNKNKAYAERISSGVVTIVAPDLLSRVTAYLSKYLWFYNRVRQGAAWDYKTEKVWKSAFPNVQYFGMDNKKYRFNGATICPTDFGNINFGYAGLALGIPRDVLYIGAGIFQLYYDHGAIKGDMPGSIRDALFKYGSNGHYGDQDDDYLYTTWGMSLYYSGF